MKEKKQSIFGLLKGYKLFIGLLTFFTIATNVGNLILPKVIAKGIDDFTTGTFDRAHFTLIFLIVSLVILVFAYLQNVLQAYASERVAKDIRTDLSAKISRSSYRDVEKVTPSKLLTNLTSDVDAIKMFISQAIVSLISSILIIVGASVLLITINWRLGLAVIALLPIIGIVFFLLFKKLSPYFAKAQGVIDWLNRVINESILGAALIRVLNSNEPEYEKFMKANTESLDIGMSILKLFAAVIPVITFVSSLAVVVILALGGHYIIGGTLTLGNFTAFMSYLSILIFPIIILGFMSNVIARASASYGRILEVLNIPEEKESGPHTDELTGAIEVSHVSINFAGKDVLKDISFVIRPRSRVAIIGPTAAGKTALLYAMIGLTLPDTGTISYDSILLSEYDQKAFHKQVGFVFQDSIMFNLTLRENIAFSEHATDESLLRAVDTAELRDFVTSLSNGLDSLVSERGTSLSGGQKQRIMLARALALNPKILYLDDFTARVDTRTEEKILKNISVNYPDITVISVTQKVATAEAYDEVIVLMEGEVVDVGTHTALLERSPEYVQIVESQKSVEK